jgi:hypothetical protein
VLRLSADLLDAPEMTALLEAYCHDVILRMIADVERRIDFWTNELERDREQVRWFKGLSVEEQNRQAAVVTDRKILKDFVIAVKTQESTVPAKVYFLDVLPRHFIPEDEEELRKLQAFHESIARLRGSPHSPIWRKCLARIVDCALRHVVLCDDPKVNFLFERWCSVAEGMLRVEWKRLLQQNNLAVSDVFKRTTFFDVDYDEDSHLLGVYPTVVVDSARSVITVNTSRRVLVVGDPLDEASPVPVGEAEAEHLGRQVRDLTGQVADSVDPNGQLRQMAYERPGMAAFICDGALAPEESRFAFAELRANAHKRAESAAAGMRCLRMLDKLAYNTAVEFLQPEDEDDPPPGKALAIAFVNCLRLGYDPMAALRQIRAHPKGMFPAEIKTPMLHAMSRGRSIVDRLMDHRQIPLMDGMELTPAMEIACEIDHCLETARLAEEFRTAATALELTGETLDSTFLKTEKAFEAAYSAIHAQTILTLERLRSILAGEPLKPTEEVES